MSETRLTSNRLIIVAALCVGSFTSMFAQEPSKWEPDEYGFPSISCGAGKVTFEYQSGSGDKIIVTGRKYQSRVLAEKAMQAILISATEVVERSQPLNEDQYQGPRVVAKFPKKSVIIERIGEWLYSTEAESFDSLIRFDAYEKRRSTRISKKVNQ